MLVRSGLTTLALALCALSNGAQAGSSVIAAARTEAALSVNGEVAAPAIDALTSFVHGVAATGQAKPSWSELEQRALTLSRTQHAGRPETLRFCEPELKVCNSGIVWTADNGTKLFLRQAEDMRGQPLEREICEINSHGDVRVCINWDTDARSRDMRDGKGHWYKIADQ
jgi:hypothetical protein